MSEGKIKNDLKPFSQLFYSAVIIFSSLTFLPETASSCIITNNPCDCEARYTPACGYHESAGFISDYILFLSGTNAKALFTLFLLAGFYWAVRDKSNVMKTLFAVTMQLIIAVAAFWLLPVLASISPALLIVWPFAVAVPAWLGRKKIVWWKALFIPLIIAILNGIADISLAQGYAPSLSL